MNGIMLAGEAAHAFPPIGAQGLNLGLRDVADLATVLRDADRTQPGWAVSGEHRATYVPVIHPRPTPTPIPKPYEPGPGRDGAP